MTEDRNFYLFGDSKMKSPRPIFNTPLTVATMSRKNKIDGKPEETFWENDQRPELLPILVSKMTHKLGPWGPHFTCTKNAPKSITTPKSSYSELKTQVSCESSGKISRQ